MWAVVSHISRKTSEMPRIYPDHRMSPAGTAELSPDASPGLDLQARPVPKGRLEIGRDEILESLQPSLRDLIMFHDVPRTGVLG